MTRPRRIVCYAINGAGLGHITRLIGVARWMRRYVAYLDGSTPEVFFLTSSDASDMLAQARFAAFKIPSKTIARAAGLDKLEYRRLAKHFVWQTLGVFSPDLLVVDTFPSGSFDELFQILDGPFKKSFIHRQVKSTFAARPTFRAALSMYDAVVVPHRPPTDAPETRVSPADATSISSALPSSDLAAGHTASPRSQSSGSQSSGSLGSGSLGSGSLGSGSLGSGSLGSGGSVSYCGEVIQFDREQLPPRESVRQELGIAPAAPLVYISAGGGGDPDAEATLQQLLAAVLSRSEVQVLVGAGPLYRGRRSAGERIIWCEAPAIWRYFAACDAAISAGGYNSFHELLYAGVPTLFFAQEKIADDQWQRVQQAAQEQACLAIPQLSDTSELQAALNKLLDSDCANQLSQRARSYQPQNGAARCARELLRPLYPADRLALASQIVSPSLIHTLEDFSEGEHELTLNWLTTVFPASRLGQLGAAGDWTEMMNQLSPSAALEVQRLLQRHSGSPIVDQLSVQLTSFLRQLLVGQSVRAARALGEEAIRAIVAVNKKYASLIGAGASAWGHWMSQVLAHLGDQLQKPSRLSGIERLRLLAMFPRWEEARNVADVFAAFDKYVESRLLAGQSTAELLQHFQVLKLSPPAPSQQSLDAAGEAVYESE